MNEAKVIIAKRQNGSIVLGIVSPAKVITILVFPHLEVLKGFIGRLSEFYATQHLEVPDVYIQAFNGNGIEEENNERTGD